MSERRGVLYADSSALVKLAIHEAETTALRAEIEQWGDVATSVITEVELARAVARAASEGAATVDAVDVWLITAATVQIGLTDEVRQSAATLEPPALRALDAIHVASAVSLGDELGGVLTYDRRMQEAVERHGGLVVAPS